MNKNYIVLNGKRYDATTGEFLGVATEVKHDVVSPAKPTETVVRPEVKSHVPSAQSVNTEIQPEKAEVERAEPAPAQHRASRTHHGTTKVVPVRKPEPAKTLMRKAVKKPVKKHHTKIRRHYPIPKKTEGVGLMPKLSVNTVDHARLRRATDSSKSARVGHFSAGHHIAPISPVRTEIKEVPVAAAPIIVQPMAQVAHAAVNVVHSPAVVHAAAAVQEAPAKVVNMFEEALAHATSHQQPSYKLSGRFSFERLKQFRHQQIAGTLAAIAAVIVIGGFVTYVNKNSMQLQVASVKAGFKASMPTYEPEGFKKQPALTNNGKVAINYLAPDSSSGFTLTQEASDWDSQTLFDTVVAESKTQFQTVQSSGRTIYVYGDNDAAWVDGGVLYKITGNAALKSDQIIKLAASM